MYAYIWILFRCFKPDGVYELVLRFSPKQEMW